MSIHREQVDLVSPMASIARAFPMSGRRDPDINRQKLLRLVDTSGQRSVCSIISHSA